MGEVVRVRLDLGYDGTDFSGWAAQPGRRTVEAELSAALTTILRGPEPVRLTVAGRTDAGVHARGQVAHADVDADAWGQLPGRSERSPEEALWSRLAGVLADDVVVKRVCVPSPGFDARFSATSRRYLYRLADDVATHDPLRRRDTVSVRGHLDAEAMNDAAYLLVGLHDFAAFCKQREGATTVRTLLALAWERGADAVLAGTVVYAFGWRHLGLVAFPLAFLVFMIPLPSIVFGHFAVSLQLIASQLGENLLRAADVPVLRDGNLLKLATVTLEVNEACSGIRSLGALVMMTTLIGYVFQRRAWGRVVLTLAAVPIAIGLNGLRIAVTGMATLRFGPVAVSEAVHTASGWVVFVAALASLWGMHLVMQSLGRQPIGHRLEAA